MIRKRFSLLQIIIEDITFGLKMLVIRWVQIVSDLFLFCYDSDFIKDFSNDNQADIIKAFNSTSRYLDGLLKEWSTKFIHLNCN